MPAKVLPIAPANPYRLVAQHQKAEKLYVMLRDAGLCHVVNRLGGMEEEQWAMLAAAAQVNMPSEATREMVMRLCRGRDGEQNT